MAKAKFAEAPVWDKVDGDWKPVHGGFVRSGISVEWHDFDCEKPLAWHESFHPESLEICLNIAGCGSVGTERDRQIVNPQSVHFYINDDTDILADRHAGQKHRFATIEISRPWLATQVENLDATLVPSARAFLENSKPSHTAVSLPMPMGLLETARQLATPPVQGPARTMWYQGKVLEILSLVLFPSNSEELFCQRHKKVSQSRVEKVKELLAKDLENPPSLPELGRIIGCSPFYLCRTFSQQTGTTISLYLRKLRMERAAEMLRSGKYNVTETAMAVGYSSLSHFSKAFSETYNTCPCSYPLKKS